MGGSVIDQFSFKCWLCKTPSSETLSALKSVSQVKRNWAQRENSRKCYCVTRCFSPSILYLGFQETNRHPRYRFRPNCDIWLLCLAKASLKCISPLEWQSYLQSKQNVSALSRSPDTIPCLCSHLPMHLDFFFFSQSAAGFLQMKAAVWKNPGRLSKNRDSQCEEKSRVFSLELPLLLSFSGTWVHLWNKNGNQSFYAKAWNDRAEHSIQPDISNMEMVQ